MENWCTDNVKLARRYKLSALMTSSLLDSIYGGGGSLTTSKKSTESSKFGFFLVSLMMEEFRMWPPHSNWMLGDVTFDNWNFFMLRTPQHNTCHTHNHTLYMHADEKT